MSETCLKLVPVGGMKMSSAASESTSSPSKAMMRPAALVHAAS